MKSLSARPQQRRRKKPFFATLIALLACVVFIISRVGAQPFPTISESGGVDVKATVGSVSLTITGFQSPYASIILKTSTGIFLSSTTADENGYFVFSNVLINQSELTYCFQAVDFRRIGITEACVTIPGPINGDVVYSDVFLPPTIGLSKKQINAGESAVIYGYSMPGATVYININDEVITLTADESGFYSYNYTDVPAGNFTISATASLNDTDSLPPTNNVVLQSLSLPQQFIDTGKDVTDTIKDKVPFNFLPFLLIGLALLTAIGILLYKLKIRPWMILIDFLRRKKKMHHDWFLDKW